MNARRSREDINRRTLLAMARELTTHNSIDFESLSDEDLEQLVDIHIADARPTTEPKDANE
ncbi:hypothetical protein [Marinobacter sp. tcs-11]|uniref:hypothetical protein n=1 Tax=Marinobacter sp. tcs-11 TaxID=1742860 RepID=UPI002579A235|nr:hypothetical protein [Marinobacter sp. tcs-11]